MVDKPDETLERVRRIETRLTKLLVHQGVETHSVKPTFHPGLVGQQPATMNLPSRHCQFNEIMAALPRGFRGRVHLSVKGDFVATLDLADRNC